MSKSKNKPMSNKTLKRAKDVFEPALNVNKDLLKVLAEEYIILYDEHQELASASKEFLDISEEVEKELSIRAESAEAMLIDVKNQLESKIRVIEVVTENRNYWYKEYVKANRCWWERFLDWVDSWGEKHEGR